MLWSTSCQAKFLSCTSSFPQPFSHFSTPAESTDEIVSGPPVPWLRWRLFLMSSTRPSSTCKIKHSPNINAQHSMCRDASAAQVTPATLHYCVDGCCDLQSLLMNRYLKPFCILISLSIGYKDKHPLSADQWYIYLSPGAEAAVIR